MELRNIKTVFMLLLWTQLQLAFTVRVRLSGGQPTSSGKTPSEGRVEIYHSGEWGTVCDNGWDIRDANVICRQLGYRQALEAKNGNYFSMGISEIWISQVACFGNESRLQDCRFSGWKNHNCSHREDAGVICNSSTFHIPVRLASSTLQLPFGRVEVLYNGEWGTVCSDDWGIADARVVCKQLGYPDAYNAKTAAYFGAGRGTIWMDDVRCNGDEEFLKDCSLRELGEENCDHHEDAGVVCVGGSVDDIGFTGVRLVGGSFPSEGKLEVFHNNEWGSVCDDFWTFGSSRVVCRQLGYSDAAMGHTELGNSVDQQPYWMKDCKCTGREKRIQECDFQDWEESCNQNEAVGVKCINTSLPVATESVKLTGLLRQCRNSTSEEVGSCL
eukprot:m.23111 g.23111  ORF g.23111 m.23111 type:complete len:385 (+) comp28441_c0_seq2:1239-2393(+)